MTEQKKHPNYEWIVAFAEGKELQWCTNSNGFWADYVTNNRFGPWMEDFDAAKHICPWDASSVSLVEWRVKPESRWYRVALYSANGQFWTSTVDRQNEEAAANSDDYFVRWLTDRVEYDV